MLQSVLHAHVRHDWTTAPQPNTRFPHLLELVLDLSKQPAARMTVIQPLDKRAVDQRQLKLNGNLTCAAHLLA